MNVELRLARDDPHRTEVERMYPLYLRDLSRFTDYYRLDERGAWQPDHLQDWLTGPLQHPYSIEVDGAPAGIAFVAQAPFVHMKSGCDHQISEFFVLDAFRRKGIGTAAARQTFDRFPGRWCVTEIDNNGGAISFWRKVIAEYAGGDFEEETAPGEVIQRFTTG